MHPLYSCKNTFRIFKRSFISINNFTLIPNNFLHAIKLQLMNSKRLMSLLDQHLIFMLSHNTIQYLSYPHIQRWQEINKNCRHG
jgi:hypothetical protein